MLRATGRTPGTPCGATPTSAVYSRRLWSICTQRILNFNRTLIHGHASIRSSDNVPARGSTVGESILRFVQRFHPCFAVTLWLTCNSEVPEWQAPRWKPAGGGCISPSQSKVPDICQFTNNYIAKVVEEWTNDSNKHFSERWGNVRQDTASRQIRW